MKSLDPRVERLPIPAAVGAPSPLDQFGTFEVFVQPKEGKPFQHEGAVHAPNLEMAFVLAKETFTRRFTCVSLYVVETDNVFVSAVTEGNQNVYDVLPDAKNGNGKEESFEIYHLLKRGKQPVHVGTVQATDAARAMLRARERFNSGAVVFNVWAVRTSDIRFTSPDENDFWQTLPEKKFRDAGDYKGGDKLKEFLERSK
ncbi:ring-1,2-phenylacetyl-CoA epoxidase subunit PaaB [Chryseolinea serpens]|uniref:Ring-1,2-phenylacetyl-CoA epoxidase subunit PaaB n=1 Tax=Chryseolinea serpens TaxID=947013 RepID=A0A1M5UF79_9BACT|nr:phenylacetic acid degradation b [Chryseolinea serpens]SHH61561.1 ring-1,2-phenylacetyl-CoA epoxidase subunit PaaB [Chryseolinea serpens]